MQLIERAEGRYEVQEAGEFGETRGWGSSERTVLECDCRARLVLAGHMSVWRAGTGGLECGVCGGRLVLVRMVTQSPEEGHRYSWLEGCLERLVGKEARHEYYTRLEERAAVPR